MSGQSDDNSGFSALSRAFKANPTLEHYVKLRRENPNEIIEVGISGAIEWLFDNEQVLTDFDIPPLLVASSLDADEASISELSLILMERLILRGELEKSGRTHLASRGEAISDSLVKYLINMMLDSLDWNDHLHIPRDLIVLIRHQLGGETSDWDKKLQAHLMRRQAITVAGQLMEQGIEPSYRKLGEVLGVNATTVMRWFPEGELRDQATQFFQMVKSILAERKNNSE